MKIEGSDIERILLSLRYAISKLKEEGATPHIEINKFNQLYDRISDGIINESKIDQSHYGGILQDWAFMNILLLWVIHLLALKQNGA